MDLSLKKTNPWRTDMLVVRKISGILVGILLLAGCSQMQQVRYGELEPTNTVEVKLKSGATVKGTLVEAEPHQLVVQKGMMGSRSIAKADIASVKRMPPVWDQFGKGISEAEINKIKTNKNSLTYGIGGGLLSFGASFFAGAVLANSISDSSGAVLGATTGIGGVLGTVLFVKAGKNKDRNDAIEAICEDRQMSVQVDKTPAPKSQDDLQRILSEEKEHQEKLRREREELLRKLQESKEEN